MSASKDYKVADISLADWGRREIAIAETEMPGLMALRQEFGGEQGELWAYVLRRHLFVTFPRLDKAQVADVA